MAPRKRRKVYLDPGSSNVVPKSTRWILDNRQDRVPRTSTVRVLPAVPSRSPPDDMSEDNHRSSDDEHWSSPQSDDFSDVCTEDTGMSDDSFTPPTSPFSVEGDWCEEEHCENSDAGPRYSDEKLSVPFIDGGTITREDAYMMLLDLTLKFGLSWTVVEEIQKLFNNLLERKAFPESRYLFKKFCGVELTDIMFHFYCTDCKSLLAETQGSLEQRQQLQVTCGVCHVSYEGRNLVRTGSFFVSLPIEKQLSSILASKTASNAVTASLSRESSSDQMRDITDGHHYHSVRKKADMTAHDLTLTVNSDGSPVFKSSKYSIWPVQVILNELPPLLRWSNVMVPLLWYGKEHPSMTLLLQAFVRQLETMNVSGIVWTSADKQVCYKVFCICCCADAPARAAMQEMIQFNGYFGCSWCYHPGTNVEGTVKYCLGNPYPDRTDDEAVADMEAACLSSTIVRGLKGPSPLINLPGFSAVWAWCPDYMHCVLLGVARQLTELWLSQSGADYYCGTPSNIRVVNERLCALRMPECINRQPRSLQMRKYWKASEWQYWLLYYSVPCLTDVLVEKYLNHWNLLVSGVFILLKDSVSASEVEHSTQLLTEFVVGVEFLYGRSSMSYNVHQVLHVPKSVILFGPLWAHSCFTFETNMGRLLKLVTSTNGVALQIATRLLLHSSLLSLKAGSSSHALFLIGKSAGKKGCKQYYTPGQARSS